MKRALISRLRHKYKACAGFKLKVIEGNPMITTPCLYCLDEFDLIRYEWIDALKHIESESDNGK